MASIGIDTDLPASIEDALIGFEYIEAAMLRTMRRADTGWKKEFIELRRQFQAQITRLSAAARECPPISSGPDSAAGFREALASLRSALALHQANWPVISIDFGDPKYQESAGKVRAASAAFTERAHQILGHARSYSRPPGSV